MCGGQMWWWGAEGLCVGGPDVVVGGGGCVWGGQMWWWGAEGVGGGQMCVCGAYPPIPSSSQVAQNPRPDPPIPRWIKTLNPKT